MCKHTTTVPSHLVAEHGHSRISERIVKQVAPIIDTLFPLVLEEFVEVVKADFTRAHSTVHRGSCAVDPGTDGR